ncbi:MAG: YciI family protein [Streptosporangiaceae bacterium]
MKYMLLICVDKSLQLSPAEGAAMGSTTESWVAETKARLAGGPLRPADTATTVRVRDGQVLVSDGPFAETKEQIAGFNVLECADLGEAVAVASRHPTAKIGTFELRPFVEP